MNSSINIIDTSRLSRRLGVSIETVRRWVVEGKLPPPTRLRRNYFVWREDDLRDVLDQADLAQPVAC